MENADALDLSKENIHPLKGGRNTSQLGWALQAQTDDIAQQELRRCQEHFEQQLRLCEGPDKLTLWCEYIAWVEQSFPKQGPEGNLHVLLQKCYFDLRGEEILKNDFRFVRLCIKFAEAQANSKEFFQILYHEGIGHSCSEFYISWAAILQLLGDWNYAMEIYKLGIKNMAQPADVLHSAHNRFKSAMENALRSNGMQEDGSENLFFMDQRQPMAALKSMSKKGLAPHVRVGPNVRSHGPGILPAAQGPSGRPSVSSRVPVMRGNNNTAPVSVYQERADPEPDIVISAQNAQYSGTVPLNVNKENEKKPGPWTNQGLGQRKHQSTSGSHSSLPRHPGFEVHKDENAGKDSFTHIHGLAVQNVLQPRKGLEDGFHDAMCIFEEPNPNVRPMYPKNQIYCGGKEFQLEELRALKYGYKKTERGAQERQAQGRLAQERLVQERLAQERHAQQRQALHRQALEMQAEEKEMQLQLHHAHLDQKDMHQRHMEAEVLAHHPSGGDILQDVHGTLSFHLKPKLAPNQGCFHSGSSSAVQDDVVPNFVEQPVIKFGPHTSHQLTPQQVVIERPTHQDSHSFNNYLVASHQPGTSSSTVSDSEQGSCSSTPGSQVPSVPPQLQASRPPNQSIYNQSMTVHTKLAMNEIANLWASPCQSKSGDSSRHNLTTSVPSLERKKPFEICNDSFAPSVLVENTFQCGDERPVTPEGHFNHVFNKYESPSQSLKFSPLRLSSLPFDDDTSVHASVQPPPVLNLEHLHDENKMETASVPSPPVLFDDPPTLTTYLKKHPSFETYQKEPFIPTVSSKPMESFQVFCDDERSSGATRTPSLEREMSTSTHASGTSIHNIAKEKENMHKFPQADVELMEECGPGPAVIPETQQMDLQHFNSEQQFAGIPPSSHLESRESYQLGGVNYPSSNKPPANILLLNQEPMDDDVTVAAPHCNVDLSETTNMTQAFFSFPKISAASTPFRSSSSSKKSPKPKKHSTSSPQSKLSEEPTKTVPPLKLYRIRDSVGPSDCNHLSTILERSKETYGSILSSGSSSSSGTVSRYAMYTTQRQSLVTEPPPQPNLSLIREASEQLSQSQCSDDKVTTPESRSLSNLRLRLSKGNFNPFDSKLHGEFLYHMGFPLSHHMDGYLSLNGAVPSKRNNILNLSGDSYNIVKALGEGAYAKVFKGVHLQSQREVALKIQKPSCIWEYYICREIQHRISNHHLALAFMKADHIYVFNNGSVIVTDLLPYGTLLALVNKVVATTKRQMPEPQVLFLVEQLISAVAALHKCKIIHGDLKPDNVLLRAIPALSSESPCIQLIDFGRSIDMSLMPPGTSFTHMVLTDSFTCIEMQTNRPWTYQTDLYGLANIAHCLLLGGYMKVQESRTTGRWTIQTKLPRSYSSGLWPGFFDALLNIESCDAMPDLDVLKADVQARINSMNNFGLSIISLGNLLLER